MVNGTSVKVETSIRKNVRNGTLFTIVEKKLDDGKNGHIVGANKIVAAIALKVRIGTAYLG